MPIPFLKLKPNLKLLIDTHEATKVLTSFSKSFNVKEVGLNDEEALQRTLLKREDPNKGCCRQKGTEIKQD